MITNNIFNFDLNNIKLNYIKIIKKLKSIYISKEEKISKIYIDILKDIDITNNKLQLSKKITHACINSKNSDEHMKDYNKIKQFPQDIQSLQNCWTMLINKDFECLDNYIKEKIELKLINYYKMPIYQKLIIKEELIKYIFKNTKTETLTYQEYLGIKQW